MATNQIQVKFSNPLPSVSANDCIHVHQGFDAEALTISFQRTLRVRDNKSTYDLPPDLGNFPLYSFSDYKETMPESMFLKGGAFMPVHDREKGLWVNFESNRPFAVRVWLGGINAISGEPIIETFTTALRRAKLLKKKAIQDYVVVDPANQA